MKRCEILKLNMRMKLNNKLMILFSTFDKNTSKFGIWIGHLTQRLLVMICNSFYSFHNSMLLRIPIVGEKYVSCNVSIMKINHTHRMKSFCRRIINAIFKVSNHVYQPHQHDESITNSLLISIFLVTQLFMF